MCYESEARCRLTCGHGFCRECIKSWYMKDKSTCPMCRGSLCFKGITKLKKEWEQEKKKQVYLDLMTQIFDEFTEEYMDIIHMCLSVVQNRFEYTICKYPKISCEELYSVLRTTWVDVDFLMNEPSVKKHPEPRTFEKYLMVSKHNKKMSVHYNEVTKRTNYNVYCNRYSSSSDCISFVWSS